MSSQRGLTLVELMVAATLLGLLTFAMFAIYRMGASAWAKGSVRSEMLADLQVATARLEKDLGRSTYSSFSVGAGGSAVSFLTPVDDTAPQTFESITGAPLWRRYVLYWLDAASGELRRREVPLPAGAPEESAPGPIESFGTSGPLALYLDQGRAVARDVTLFTCSVPGPNRPVRTQLTAQRQRYGTSRVETASLRSTVWLRN